VTERGFPLHCPYCGETDLWPHEPAEAAETGTPAPRGAWECRGCLRAFSLSMLGMVRPGSGVGGVGGVSGVTGVSS